MIAAAALCAEDRNAPPPRELILYWQCKRFGSLPVSGGILDQPAGLVSRMCACGNAYEAMQSFLSASSHSDWIYSHPVEWAMVSEVYKWRAATR